MKNLAGFNRDFRFTGQKHICPALKDGRRANSNTENPTIRRKNVYEKSKDYAHIGSAPNSLLCPVAGGYGKTNTHTHTDSHADATR